MDSIAPQTANPVIVVPLRNEEALIGACLSAIARQHGPDAPHVVLLLNNTTDGTARVAHDVARSTNLRLTVHHHIFPLPDQTAGHARRMAMQRAVAAAQPGAALLCTDADGQVAPDWLAANLFHLRHGADAVAGQAVISPVDAAAIPAALHAADARECAYATLLDEIASLLDPDPADPWPRHTEHSGASICVTQDAYHRSGGIPAASLGEDRAFFQALKAIDARIRHAPEVRVTVSGRTAGRTCVGMADTICRRLMRPDPFIDDALEPALDRVRRLRLRARFRQARANPARLAGLAGELCWPLARVIEAADLPSFGAAWAILESQCAGLAKRPVPTTDLESQIAIASRVLKGLYRPNGPAERLVAAD